VITVAAFLKRWASEAGSDAQSSECGFEQRRRLFGENISEDVFEWKIFAGARRIDFVWWSGARLCGWFNATGGLILVAACANLGSLFAARQQTGHAKWRCGWLWDRAETGFYGPTLRKRSLFQWAVLR